MEYAPSPKTKIYLATAFSYKSKFKLVRRIMKAIRTWRVSRAYAWVLTQGYNVFSPISMSAYCDPDLTNLFPKRLNTHTVWLGLDFAWIDACDELWVYMQDGWKESHGVLNEIEYAKSKGMPVRYLTKDYRVLTYDVI
jgi:hypothetical protein